ncbi:glycosyltransferase family 4 protein [Niabella beijingensis]|uniref:glycosyltransferase family 4 protein n=1 Tax=Niabella beijingensis TaxID=2872700 RepID=UPI001CBE0034|nr:glycosyltransferase family 1 protein [Niabella beijingensis]MBZ4190004.1 glycosyltransferase family 4 protein [Niabella beijingensis]
MKIAINASFYGPRTGGIGTYIYNLITHLEQVDVTNDYIIYLAKDYFKYGTEKLPQRWKFKATPFASNSKIKRSITENKFWLKEEKDEQFDVFHSPFFHSPKLKHAKTILTVHDMRFERYPKTYSPLRYLFLKYKVKKSIERANKIIAISQFTKDELLYFYKIDDKKVKVIHEAINFDDFRDNDNTSPSDLLSGLISNRYILSVGHIEPRKNYINLIRAFNMLLKTNNQLADLKLVIVGKRQHNYVKVIKLINQNKNIIYTDFVSFSDLKWLYKHAELFAFPSIYEGFGFPPLEAAALGTVSTVSNASCIPEICGDSVLYFDPLNTHDIAKKIEILLMDKTVKENYGDQLRLNLDRFSWTKNANETLSCYKLLLKNEVN